MRRVLILGAVLAASIGAAPAFAQRPITIDEVRASARTGVPALLMQEDARRFADCGLPPILPQETVPMMETIAEAKAAGVEVSVIWMRHNLAGIEKCLKGQRP